jgi:hypothetical protein
MIRYLSVMSRDHNFGLELWSNKTSTRALQPRRRVVEMGESRKPFRLFAACRGVSLFMNNSGCIRYLVSVRVRLVHPGYGQNCGQFVACGQSVPRSNSSKRLRWR